MTRGEFVQIMAYLGAGIGKRLEEKAVEVYFDLLGDMPASVLQLAAKRVLLEHRWATFPSIAELRQAAAETARGEVNELSAAEAWEMARRAGSKIDLDIVGSCERHMGGLPPMVQEAMRAFGVAALACGRTDEPLGVQRAHFMKIFEQLATRERRVALLPRATRDELRRIADQQAAKPLPSPKAPAAIPGADQSSTPGFLQQLEARFSLPITEVLPTPAMPEQDPKAQFLARPPKDREEWLQRARVRFPGKPEDFILDAAARLCRAVAVEATVPTQLQTGIAPYVPPPGLATTETRPS